MAKSEAPAADTPKEPPAAAPVATAEESAPPPAATASTVAASDPYGSAPEAAAPAAGGGDAAPAASAEDADDDFQDDFEEATNPADSFQAARDLLSKIHAVLGKLSDCKQAGGDTSTDGFSNLAWELQHELLAMRRTHRSMVKAGDVGRAAEAAARRKLDAALAHLETRRYESGCLRTASRRCRTFPTPELDKLRPNLQDGSHVEGDDPDSDDEDQSPATVSSGLAKRLEAERQERHRLDAQVEELDRVKSKETEAIRELQAAQADFANLIEKGLKALEPAMNHIESRRRPSGANAPDEHVLAALPTPLRLVYLKFENIASFGEDSGLSVSVEGVRADGPPPEKKTKTEASQEPTPAVCVKISDASKSSKHASLRFTAPRGAIVHVEGGTNDALLDCLWPEDNGSKTVEPFAGASELPGRAYYWAQVLAGLRDTVSTSADLAAMEGVSAMDVMARVRDRMAAKSV